MSTISVIIPCYRQAHFLADAIDSVLSQQRAAHEIIVVDDGSPDDVAGVVATYPNVRRIAQENRGLSEARNTGLRACTGAYVVFLDADDRLLPNALEAGASTLDARGGCAFVWGFNRPIDANGARLPLPPTHFDGEAGYEALLERNVVGAPVGVMFRRVRVIEAGGFSSAVDRVEDYEIYLRLARKHECHCHGELIAEYRQHGENMSADLDAMLAAMLRVLDLQEPFVAGDARLRRALRNGRRDAWRRFDGTRRLLEIGARRREGRWLAVAASILDVVVRYPLLSVRTFASRLRAS